MAWTRALSPRLVSLVLLILALGANNVQKVLSLSPLDPPCYFNPLCSCSKPHPDLGKVSCLDVPLPVVPVSLNSSSVYILVLRRNGLRTIESRSFFGTGLSRLEVTSNELSSLSSTALAGIERTLRELVLSSNRLTRVPRAALGRLSRLRELNLNDNSISELRGEADFPASLRTSLKVLKLSNNDLSALEPLAFKNLLSLELLDLSSNSLKALHEWTFLPEALPPEGHQYVRVETMTSLMSLNLADNRLERVPFEALQNLTGLRKLDLRSNLITATDSLISGRQLTLSELRLDENKIGELSEGSLRSFVHIEALGLSYNPIKKIGDNAFAGVRLGSVDLRGCGLEATAPGAWTGLERYLKGLDISSNRLLPSFPGLSDVVLFNDSFANLEHLTRFSLDDNSGSVRLSPLSLLSSQHTLQELSLKSSNFRYAIAPFSPVKFEMHFPNIRRLSMSRLSSGQRLTRLDLLGFGDYNLEDLDLSSASLEELTADAFESTPSLRRLNLANNLIKRIDLMTFRPLGRSLLELNLNSGLGTRTLPCGPLLEPLASLRTLSLMSNALEQFASSGCFKQLRKLQVLALDYNSIKAIGVETFASNSDLKVLSMSFNKLSSVEEGTFLDLEHLEQLDISYNFLSRVKGGAFANLAALRVLNLEGNELEHIEAEAFSYLPKLESLNLAHNQLRSFSLRAFDQVGTMSTLSIKVNGNLIGHSSDGSNGPNDGEHLSLATYPETNSVESLDLSSNALKAFDVELLDSIKNSLTKLSLSRNDLANITSSTVSRLKHCQAIDLSSNKIEFLLPDALKEDFSLQVLDLSDNLINDLLSDTFRDNVNLRVLSLSNNLLRSLPDNLFRLNHQLEVVDLSSNRLTCLPTSALRHVSSTLRVLNCGHNLIRFLRLEDIQLVSFNRLLKLDLSDNLIKTLPENFFNDFSQLKTLSVSSNPIRVLSDSLFDGLSGSLEELFMSSAELRSIPMLNLPRLRSLDISFNFIATPNSISLSNITALEHLNFAGNHLGSSPNNLWAHLNRLRTLSLSSNPIVSLDNDSFTGLDRLETLSIVNLTRLATVSTGTLKPLVNIQSLEVSSYPAARLIGGSAPANSGNVQSPGHHQRFVISKLIEDITSLRELSIVANGSEFSFPGRLPPKVNHVSVKGDQLIRVEPAILSQSSPGHASSGQQVRVPGDRGLTLSIKDTNVSAFSPGLFNSALGRRPSSVALDLRDNALVTLPDFLVATPYLMNRKVSLRSLRLSGNPLVCDCKLAWIRDWIKQIKASTLPFTSPLLLGPREHHLDSSNYDDATSLDTESPAESPEERLEQILLDIRAATCRKSGRSLLDLFRKELRDCRSSGMSSRTMSSSTMVQTLLLLATSFFQVVLNQLL